MQNYGISYWLLHRILEEQVARVAKLMCSSSSSCGFIVIAAKEQLI
jgi:hypothetical protein